MNGIIRLAEATDSRSILNIYAPYITDTAITFEVEVPEVNEFALRIETISKQYPYLVYQVNGEIVGYAYASSHRQRQAYCYDVDVSIYVEPQYHGEGIVHRLYDCLFKILKELNYCNAYASYTVPNKKSQRFHEKFGFVHVGTYHRTGYKLGKWHDVAWLEKSINDHTDYPPRIKSIKEISRERIKEFLAE